MQIPMLEGGYSPPPPSTKTRPKPYRTVRQCADEYSTFSLYPTGSEPPPPPPPQRTRGCGWGVCSVFFLQYLNMIQKNYYYTIPCCTNVLKSDIFLFFFYMTLAHKLHRGIYGMYSTYRYTVSVYMYTVQYTLP